MAQLFGHTHFDELEIFFAPDREDSTKQEEPVSVAYLGPSITTRHGLNPSYRIYEIDGVNPSDMRAFKFPYTYYYSTTSNI